jgi:hypothetical protein
MRRTTGPTDQVIMDIITPSAPADIPAEESAAKTESTVGSMLSNSKTQLAIGVAATLGVMIFYKWREKQLAEKDPEEYARLQRIKASVRSGENDGSTVDDDDIDALDLTDAYQARPAGPASGASGA